MNHLFVSYSLALKLKEKGFDEPCFAYYQLSHTSEEYTFHVCGEYTHYRDHYINFVGIGLKNSDLKFNPTGRKGNCMTAPLYQQALSWIREKYNFHIKTDWFLTTEDKIDWDYCIQEIGMDIDDRGNSIYIRDYDAERGYSTPEEANNVAIEKAIKLLP